MHSYKTPASMKLTGALSHKANDSRSKTRRLRSRITGNLGNVTVDVMNGTIMTRVHGISLIQAARDDLMDVVKTSLECYRQQIDEIDEDGFTALHYAARYNRVAVAEILLNAGADLEVKQSPDQVTPLHLACRYNSDAVIQQLLIRGAAVNAADAKGRTPLHYATRRGHEIAIKMLISVSSCNVNAVDNDLTTALIMSAIQGNSFICESLISRGADIERCDINDMSALMWASAEGHAQVIKILLKAALRRGKYLQRSYIKASDKDGNTALHLAVQNGSLEVVEILLNNGAEVNCAKNNLSTPLHIAASYGFLEIAKILVYKGAEIDSLDIDQVTPMHRAALYNKVELLEFLYKHKGNINSKDKRNTLPLHYACWKGQTKAVEFLLSNGAQLAECDSSLKTAVHWAVQFGHFETLRVLMKNGGKSVLDYTDKNDQTVLHYAAHTGNVFALKLLLEAGAQPDAKDLEERSALYFAAEKGNVSCVEALIQASNRETNDDDVDGRTPLLVACLNGHHQTVHTLLLLGGDITMRDDERRTALMLAAGQGHVLVMKNLLGHHANINDIDKNKNTALHHACAGGHAKAVELLLDRKADVTMVNTYNETALDQAVDNQNSDVVFALLKDKSTCHACLSVRNAHGKTALDRLIEKLPDAAMIVLDHSVDRSVRDDEERTLTITFDYQYIDPGPDDPASVKNRYFALNTMIRHDREALLSHPVCQNIIAEKWYRFGRILFFFNMLTYLGYLTCLTSYAILRHPTLPLSIVDYHVRHSANVDMLSINNTNMSLQEITAVITERQQTMSVVFGKLLYGFIAGFFIRELLKIYNQKGKYLFSVYNIIVWILMCSTLIFIHSFRSVHYLFQWQAGWIAIFLAWINFIMYLRRIDTLGIYVIMFTNVLGSLLKVILLFLMLAFAFASAFYIVMQDVPMFYIENVLLNVIVMTIGEFQFNDVFLEKSLDPFDTDVRILLGAFCFLMTIVLMNLTIGVAVGDIEKTHRNAYLKKIGLQVDLMYDIENHMPMFIQQAVHSKRAVIKPSDGVSAGVHKVAWRLFASTGKVQFIHPGAKDKVTSGIEAVTDKMQSHHTALQSMQVTLDQRSTLLQAIAVKLDARTPPTMSNHASPAHHSIISGDSSLLHSHPISSSDTETSSIYEWLTTRPPMERLDSLRSTIV